MAHNNKNLDRSLDDIIRDRQMNNSSSSFGRPTNQQFFSSSGSGPDRPRFPNRVRYRAAPYSVSQMETRVWRGPARTGEGAAGGGVEADAKLYISNLDSRVTNGDLEILFSELGELRDYSVHYDRGGRSLGTARVVYMTSADAVAAQNRYNGVKLDGKPMKIEFVGVNVAISYLLSPVTMGEVPDHSSGFRGRLEDEDLTMMGGEREETRTSR